MTSHNKTLQRTRKDRAAELGRYAGDTMIEKVLDNQLYSWFVVLLLWFGVVIGSGACFRLPPSSSSETKVNSTETRTRPIGADSPRELLDRMYSAVEKSDRAEFHVCHIFEGEERRFLDITFDYLMTQSYLRRAATIAYGQDATATVEIARGGVLGFDTSRFPELTIEENGDTAHAHWTEKHSRGQATTHLLLLKRINGRWRLFATPAPETSHPCEHPYVYQMIHRQYLRSMVIAQTKNDLMQVLVEEVRSGSIKAGELDEWVQNHLSSYWKP